MGHHGAYLERAVWHHNMLNLGTINTITYSEYRNAP